MSDASPSPSPTDAWVREALERLAGEVALFARTFASFLIHPGRSATDWRSGERSFMNPLAFAGMAAGTYWAIISVLAALWPTPRSNGVDTMSDQLSSAIGPYLHYGLLGVVMHALLRALGSRRSVFGSVGVAFFTGGSIGTLGALPPTAAARWFAHSRGTAMLELTSGDLVPVVLLGVAVVFYVLLCVTMASALRGLHRVAGWKVAAAATFAVIATSLLFGSVLPSGSYGWHPYIAVGPEGGIGLGFRD
jgi:hypothetical protein